MSTKYYQHKVRLSDGQKKTLFDAMEAKTAITLRLKAEDLSGGDTLHLTETQINRLKKAAREKKGVDLKMSKAQLSHMRQSGKGLQLQRGGRSGKGLQLQRGGLVNPGFRSPPFIGSWENQGGSLASTLGSTLLSAAPTIGKTLGLSALGGLASEAASQILKKIVGGKQGGGFLVPQGNINQLSPYMHLLTAKQKKDFNTALQSGAGFPIIPTKTQAGGILGTLLASIGIPLALKAVSKLIGGGKKN